MLPAGTRLQDLAARRTLAFPRTNQKNFRPGANVVLELQVKNIPKVFVQVRIGGGRQLLRSVIAAM